MVLRWDTNTSTPSHDRLKALDLEESINIIKTQGNLF
jgi:hypothetical protein